MTRAPTGRRSRGRPGNRWTGNSSWDVAGNCTIGARHAGRGGVGGVARLSRAVTIAAPSASPSPGGPGEIPSCADVPASYWAYGWIERFLALGVAAATCCRASSSVGYSAAFGR